VEIEIGEWLLKVKVKVAAAGWSLSLRRRLRRLAFKKMG
jgi:hypothetical protein